MIEEKEFLKDWQESIPSTYPDNYLIDPIPEHELLPLYRTGPIRKILDIDYVNRNEWTALFWLAGEIHYSPMELMNLVGSIRRGRVHYCLHHRKKKNGELRVLNEPSPTLKKIQRRIKDYLLFDLPSASNVYGFSGGNIINAITPHLKAKSRIMIDIKDAFPSILFRHLLFFLRYSGNSKFYVKYSGKPIRGYFSWTICRVICELCTHEKFLPQGAPSSPRLFDLVFSQVDEELNNLAHSSKTIYTRYADNIFFSSPKKVFPSNLIWDVVKIIEGEFREDLKLGWHKLKVCNLTNEAIRTLGLNIINGWLHNTRKFKRRLRLLVYHINWLLGHNQPIYDEYEQLMGMLGFAIKDSLPPKLLTEIERITKPT